jgi:hypothetical protein
MFSVRAHFSEEWEDSYTTQNVVGLTRTGFNTVNSAPIVLNVVATCTIPWQNFKVVGGRNTSGNTLGR